MGRFDLIAMKHIPLLAIFSLSTLLVAAADDPKPEASTSSTTNPVLEETVTNPVATTAASPSTARGISPQTAARLAALTPKYTPPPPAAPADENPVVKDTEDKPKNGIVRLPAYLVREPKMPALSEAQVLTPRGRVDLAYKAFPGLRFGNIWFLRNDAIANAMLEEELMAARAREIADLMSLLPANQPESDSPRARLIRDALTPRSSPSQMGAGDGR